MHEVQPNSAERESESEGKGEQVCGSNLMYYTKYVVSCWLLPLCCESSFVVIVGFTPKVGPCTMQCVCVCGPSW
jgi:hypothetical protein